MKKATKKEKPLQVLDASAPKDVDHDEWKIKDAAETLMRAEEIKEDPELHAKAKKHLQKKGAAIKRVTDLRELSGKPLEEDEEA